MHTDDLSAITAYQTSSLHRLQQAYDVLDVDVNSYLAQERQIADDIDELTQKFRHLTETEQCSRHTPELPMSAVEGDRYVSNAYSRIDLLPADHFATLANAAKLALEQQGIDPERDPLLQVLHTQQIGDITTAYRRKYGDVMWQPSDYAVVTLAGALGAVLELLVVKLPGHSEFLLTLPQGCAMAAWLAEHVKRLQQDLPETIDALMQDSSETVAGDWLWRVITVLLDLVRHSGTSINDRGNIVTARRLVPETERAYITVLLRSIFQAVSPVFRAVDIDDPFEDLRVLLAGSSDSWDAVAIYAQIHGYRPLLLLREGMIPAAIELFVQGYWLLRHYACQEQLAPACLKLTSMLALSHTLAISGYLVKSGVLFHIDPLALNWSQMMRCLPLLLSWINQGIEREQSIRDALDEEWRRLYQRALSFNSER